MTGDSVQETTSHIMWGQEGAEAGLVQLGGRSVGRFLDRHSHVASKFSAEVRRAFPIRK